MKHDKKTRGGDVRFVLVRDVAAWEVAAVPDADILSALKAYFEMKCQG